MIEYLLGLPQKELEKILKFNNVTPVFRVGDYVHLDQNKYLGQIEHINKKDEKCVIYTGKFYMTLYSHDLYKVTLETISSVRNKYTKNKLLSFDQDKLVRFLNKILSEIYSIDTFDVGIMSTDKVYAIIHYPQITITNSMGASHIIYDLYVKFTFRIRSERIMLYDISCARMSFESNEYVSSKGFYKFSHIHITNSPWEMESGFCYGAGNFFSFINKLGSEGFTLLELRQFFFSFNEYLKWESLEGTPYYSFMKLPSKFEPYDPPFMFGYNSLITSIYNKVIEKIDHFVYYYSDHLRVDLENSVIEEVILELAKDDSNLDILFCYYYKGGYTRFKNYEKYDISKYKDIKSNFEFKGDRVNFKIMDENEDIQQLTKDLPLIIHPNVFEDVKSKIRNEFLNYLIINLKCNGR